MSCSGSAAKPRRYIFRPIVGFIVKDRLGQAVFGENTYLTCFDKPLIVKSEFEFEAHFSLSDAGSSGW